MELTAISLFCLHLELRGGRNLIGLLIGASGYYRKARTNHDRASPRPDAEVTRAFAEMVEAALDSPNDLAVQKSLSVILEFGLIKQDAIRMIAKLPADMNVQIAEIIREKVHAGDWPKEIERSNAAIISLIEEYINQFD